MNIKKMAMSALTASAAGVILGGSTFAFFTDQGTSSNNVFSAGTLIMKLSDSNETDADNVTASWGFTNAIPGDTFTGTLNVKNTGTVNAASIDFDVTTVTISEGAVGDEFQNPPTAGQPAKVELDKVIRLTTLTWDADGAGGASPINLLTLLDDTNGNGIKDVDDLETGLTTPASSFHQSFSGTQNSDHALVIAGVLDASLTANQHQGDQATMSLAVTLNQQP